MVQAIGGRAPVKVVWTREDDIRGGRYRPMYFHTLKAGLDAQGDIVGWQHRIVGQSILKGTPFEGALVQNGIDQTSVEGANNLPYAVPNVTLIDVITTDVTVPVLWWRAVGSTHTAYSIETFIDELAQAAGRDPVEFRRGHAGRSPAASPGAGTGGGEGRVGARHCRRARARGVAVHESFNSYVAEVAEVSVTSSGTIKVERVVCAVDCGVRGKSRRHRRPDGRRDRLWPGRDPA